MTTRRQHFISHVPTAADVQARLDAWSARGEPECLWPHVRSVDRQRAHELITRVTGDVLNGRVPATMIFDADLAALGVAAYVAGMGPLLGWWIENAHVSAQPESRELLALHLEHNRLRISRLELELKRVIDACHARSLDIVVLKGAHIGNTYFPEPGTRPATDIDLLVEAPLKPAIHGALTNLGYVETRATVHPERSEWCLAGVSQLPKSLEMEHAEGPWTIDLHTTLDRTYFRGLTASFGAHAFTATTTMDLGGKTVRVLQQPLLVAYLALSASHSVEELRLLKVVELIMVIRRDVANGTLNWDQLAALVRELGIGRFVYPIFALAENLAPRTLPAEFVAMLSADTTRRLRRVVAAVSSGQVELGGRSLTEKLMWAHGPAELSRNLIDVLLPPSSGMSIEELRQSYIRRARRAIQRHLAVLKMNSNHGPTR